MEQTRKSKKTKTWHSSFTESNGMNGGISNADEQKCSCLGTNGGNPCDVCSMKDKPIDTLIKSNLFKRVILSMLMIGAFSYLISLSNLYLVVFLFYLGFFINREVVSISKENDKFSFDKFIVYGFLYSIFMYYSGNSLDNVSKTILKYSTMTYNIYFYSYILLLILFVVSLKKSKLKSQFGLFALVHLTGYLCGVSIRAAVNNLYQGKFWLVFPSALVICNDICAYIVGKSIGRTQLYKLSPKKTIEGFIGGFICTALFGILFCYFQLKYKLLTDIYLNEVSLKIELGFWWFRANISYLYIHCIFYVLVASFIAPFSGFFASGLKRAFNKKDFGSSIPGHGGFTDRFDCQCIMALFTSVYLKTFLCTRVQSIFNTFVNIISKMNKREIVLLIDFLRQYVSQAQ